MGKEFRNCKWCGKQFIVMNPHHIYCCTECYDESNKPQPQGFRLERTKQPKYLTGSQEEAGKIAKQAWDAGMKYGDYVAKNKL